MAFGPYDAATHLIGRAEALLAEAKSASLPTSVRGDMRRLSLVMAVAALDTYMHRLVVDRSFKQSELPGGLANLQVTFKQLVVQADEAGRAARKPPHQSRPRVAVKRQLRDRLLRETFQRYDDVSRALGMAGRTKLWDKIAAEFTPPVAKDDIKRRLNEIVDRRNKIVHEGDYQRLERPRTPKRNGITLKQASADIDFLRDLVDAIHAVA